MEIGWNLWHDKATEIIELNERVFWSSKNSSKCSGYIIEVIQHDRLVIDFEEHERRHITLLTSEMRFSLVFSNIRQQVIANRWRISGHHAETLCPLIWIDLNRWKLANHFRPVSQSSLIDPFYCWTICTSVQIVLAIFHYNFTYPIYTIYY
jgi:hypothetical protein